MARIRGTSDRSLKGVSASMAPPSSPPSGDSLGTVFEGVLRRVPASKKGQATLDRILDAAQEVLLEVGYDQAVATPALLVQRAQIPPATLYTYFSGAENVMEALALRVIDDFKGVTRRRSEEVHPDWRSAAEHFFDSVVSFYSNAVTQALWSDGHLSRSAREAAEAAITWAAQRLAEMLQNAQEPGPSLDSRCYRVAMEIADHLPRLAFRGAPRNRGFYLAEAKKVFLAYLMAAGEQ